MSNASPLYLIACSAAKVAKRTSAADLYRGDLFQKARAFVEQQGAPWRILSAKYGLVHPTDILDPYNVTLADMTALERLQWGESVARWLPAGRQIVFLAGRAYREAVLSSQHMANARNSCTAPMEGLGIGQQKAWLLGRTQQAAPQLLLI